MLSRWGICLAGLAAWAASAWAEGPVLVRGGEIASVRTFQGAIKVQLAPITPSPDVTLVVLNDTFQDDDLLRVRRAFTSVFNSGFLGRHPLRIINVAGTGGDVSSVLATPAQLYSLR